MQRKISEPNALPLTVFEEYMLLDDSPAFPMEFCCRLVFEGKPDSERLAAAIRAAVERQPLFNCRVQKTSRRRFEWVSCETDVDLRRITLDSETERATIENASGFPNMKPLTIFKRPGFRAWLIESPTNVDLILQFHHSVCDGAGMLELVQDLLIEYAVRSGIVAADFERRPIDPTLLPQRGKFGWSLRGYLKNALHTDATTRRFLYSKASPFLPVRMKDVNVPCGEYPFVRTSILSREETARLVRFAKRRSATVNDCLMTDVLLAVDSWRKSRRISPPQGKTRLAIPVNLRDGSRRAIPACNVVSMVFVDFSRRNIESENLLAIVGRKMATVKKREQKFFLDLVLKAGKFLSECFGSNLSFFLRANWVQGTVCLTNLGKILDSVPLPKTDRKEIELGDCRLKYLETVAPVRKGTQASLAVQTFAERLGITLRFDPRYFNCAEADDFMATLFQNIRNRIESVDEIDSTNA